jgi:hypothetical protein
VTLGGGTAGTEVELSSSGVGLVPSPPKSTKQRVVASVAAADGVIDITDIAKSEVLQPGDVLYIHLSPEHIEASQLFKGAAPPGLRVGLADHTTLNAKVGCRRRQDPQRACLALGNVSLFSYAV